MRGENPLLWLEEKWETGYEENPVSAQFVQNLASICSWVEGVCVSLLRIESLPKPPISHPGTQ